MIQWHSPQHSFTAIQQAVLVSEVHEQVGPFVYVGVGGLYLMVLHLTGGAISGRRDLADIATSLPDIATYISLRAGDSIAESRSPSPILASLYH